MKSKLASRLNVLYFICISLLILFGIYKNSINVYINESGTIIECIRPILILFMAISGSFLGSLVREFKSKKKLHLDYLGKMKEVILNSMMFACVLPIKSSPIIVFSISFLIYLFIKETKVNLVALMALVVLVINHFLKLNVYANAYELSRTLNYNGIDRFFGFGAGGIFSTCIALVLFSLIVLSSNDIYKKEIAISAIITYNILVFGFVIMTSNYGAFFDMLFSYNILFSFVFIAPIVENSCYTTKGKVTFGILIAFMTFVIGFFFPYYGVLTSILFASLISKIIDRIFIIK